ncbi:MAG TPA: thioesterase family protein [Steroidobacteraceae bacterium]|jgi:4-hydroxybenzoyl-CoA thioesterase|nr:thioesterase family protein [Steroidobacteraceae bacterium]
MLTVTRKVRVEWGDCDAAGIVYFPRYFVYFDNCTAGMFEAVGFLKPALLKAYDIAGFPVVDVRANFRRPSTFGDDVMIHTTIPEWGRTSFKVHHKLMKGDDLAIEGFETRVWVGHDSSRPGAIKARPIPQELFERFRNA